MPEQNTLTDTGFPVIRYDADCTPRQRGTIHGESWRQAILELVEIRTQLMHEKNPGLDPESIERLAAEQWSITRDYDHDLTDELEGIRQGANISIEQLVILNNYTDFRDIQVADQGCSMIYVADSEDAVAGQTWDMHGSAKNYVCVLDIRRDSGRQIVFSITGCAGMMGFATGGLMIGVNNINTDGARAGVMWPVVVRRALQEQSRPDMVQVLKRAPITSGHNYLVADRFGGEMWEIMPDLAEKVLDSDESPDGKIFHTNHCLSAKTRQREQVIAQNSTTHIRYGLLEKKIGRLRTVEDGYQLLNDHENYPKSICSNYQTDSQDPSITCGGAVGGLQSGTVQMWRGDPENDSNFVCRKFEL